MLKYSIKLTNDSIKQEEIVWREKYLSPDLSFISGVTSQDYHLEKSNVIAAANSISHTPNTVLPIETKNVIREGFIVIKGKEYNIESGKTYDGEISYLCVQLNGKYYYCKDNIFLIDNWLQCTDGNNVEEKPYSASLESNNSEILKIDTIEWIEDGIVSIDGEEYIYDFNLNGLLKNGDDKTIDASAITKCQKIEFYPYSDINKYDHVTKFVVTKSERINEIFEKVSFIKNYYYIVYKNSYFNIYNNENKLFECDIQKSLVGENGEGLNTYTAYTDTYTNDNFDSEIPTVVSGDSFDILKENLCYIEINGDKFEIQNGILNANDGTQIGIYLENAPFNVNVGDIVYFLDNRDYSNSYNVYTDAHGAFILFKGERYDVEANICDKVLIKDNEYNIEYINGKNIGSECVVCIDDDEYLPMIISGNTDYLIQKGLVVSGSPSSAVTMTYPIISYSGISIDNKKYQVDVVDNEANVEIDIPNEYKFIISDIQGSSMLVCEPYLSTSDFSEDFIKNISFELCNEVVTNKTDFALYFNNNIFGNREITKDLAYNEYSGSTSSDDYFNLFDNLSLYAPNGYIHIPLLFEAPQGNNLLQDDIISNDFYKREKDKSINPIIDMEKDVYLPKYFEGEYSGSQTIFKAIKEIRFNLHFRTRDLASWKVNENYNDESTSGLCNWFATDFYPYNKILNPSNPNENTERKKEKIRELYESSDVVGLLNFVNDDVFYQKSKISKSFLRLSFYDSTDQQTQMLLGTSTIFMDSHRIFKNYVDNSRDGLYKNQFLGIEEVFDGNPNLLNKINVKTEFISGKTNNNNILINNISFEDDKRLGSELIINNKYETDSSSEGYYLYIFREYSEKLTPKPIYMKAEFNHAGIGRTIPFIVPMKWGFYDNTNGYSVTTDVDVDGNKVPVRKLTFFNNIFSDDNDDLAELKKGVKLEDLYAQSYIPLYAVYDFKNKEYAYVFDNRYVDIDENGNLRFNLFEIKLADDTITDENIIVKEQKNITKGIQPTAIIDMNKDMFGNKQKICGS